MSLYWLRFYVATNVITRVTVHVIIDVIYAQTIHIACLCTFAIVVYTSIDGNSVDTNGYLVIITGVFISYSYCSEFTSLYYVLVYFILHVFLIISHFFNFPNIPIYFHLQLLVLFADSLMLFYYVYFLLL